MLMPLYSKYFSKRYPKRYSRRHQQKGFTLLEMVIAVSLFGLLMTAAQSALNSSAQRVVTSNTVTGFNAVIEASYAFYINEAKINPLGGSWPGNINDLVSGGFLPLFANGNGVGLPYSLGTPVTGDGLIVSTEMSSAEQILTVAQAFGAIAETGTVPFSVTVGIGIPGTESSHESLLDREGNRPMTGTLVFDPGANINLQGNDILQAGSINTTSISADSGAIETLTVTDLIYTNLILDPNP